MLIGFKEKSQKDDTINFSNKSRIQSGKEKFFKVRVENTNFILKENCFIPSLYLRNKVI